MTKENETSIQIPGASAAFRFAPGSTTVVVGANGSGKTKLAMECERRLGEQAHRISAQRMLSIDPSIEKTTESIARNLLKYGYREPEVFGDPMAARENQRWGKNGPHFILDDAGALLQVLFAEQANTAVKTYNALKNGVEDASPDTFMRRLLTIFQRVLPARDLSITADAIEVKVITADKVSHSYPASDMSDGEKAVFYLIGQVLVADSASVFIMDEPEVHIHPSILSRLWDELESARPDCSFLVITHDLDFAASRAGEKFAVESYTPENGWSIERVPEAEGFPEHLVTLILGSRKPILFVEGESGSLDAAFYRACYPEWTVIPRGGCESVIHAVASLRRNANLTRVHCVGLVDADDRDEIERAAMEADGVYSLPVAEIENLILLPDVSRAILEMEHLEGAELEERLRTVASAILDDVRNDGNLELVVVDYCRRRIDRSLAVVDLSESKTVGELSEQFTRRVSELDVESIADDFRERITAALDASDIEALLKLWDRKKPLLAIAARVLRKSRVADFTSWIMRAVRSSTDDRLRVALAKALPAIPPIPSVSTSSLPLFASEALK